jgi:hypothetical protein
MFVSIHARDRATTHGRAYVSAVLDYPPEGGGFQPELAFDEVEHAAGDGGELIEPVMV